MNHHQDSELSQLVKARATRYEASLALRDRLGAALSKADSL